MRGSKVILAAGILAAVLLAAGVMRLFALRFEAGDVYPPYSSLRSDPLGTRVLYESLRECGAVSVERNFQPPEALHLNASTALFYLGDTIEDEDDVSNDAAASLNSFLRRGGRLVFTFLPWEPESDTNEETCAEASTNDQTEADGQDVQPDDNTADDEADDEDTLPVGEWLGIACADTPLPPGAQAVRGAEPAYASLPRIISCHTTLTFCRYVPPPTNDVEQADGDEDADTVDAASHVPAEDDSVALAGWHTVYARDGKPVVIERSLGRGSIVLSAETFFVSNEAMRVERHPELLSWLLAGRPRVVFDEYHHGLEEPSSSATLAWRYRLQGLLGGILLIGLLFVWRNSVSLVPPGAAEPDGPSRPVQGFGSASGLVNLLRRNIPADRLPRECLEQWRRSCPSNDPKTAAARVELERIVAEEERRPARQRDAAKAYAAMCEAVRRHGRPEQGNGKGVG